MKRLSLILALLAGPAAAQHGPGGDGFADLPSSYTTPGNPYYGRPLPRTMSGTWHDLRASNAIMWHGFVAPGPDYSNPNHLGHEFD